MDQITRSRFWTGKGGIVEPGDRAQVAVQTFQAPGPNEGPRFELRDATTDLVYRSKSFDDMVAKADHVGALRFTAIDEHGQRSFVHKADGSWQRPAWLESVPAREREAAERPTRSAVPEGAKRDQGAKVVPLTPAPSAEAAVARIDAEAERDALVARLEAALNERYFIKRAMVTVHDRPVGETEYRFRGDTSRVAFTESTFRLATDTNSPSVARSMVDVAQARDWKALRVSGHEEFRRMVWFEASLRGVRTIGYEPMPSDMAWLRSEREARQVNRIEPTTGAESASTTAKTSARGSGSRKTVLAAIEAVLVAQKVSEKRCEAIMAAAAENLAKRLAAGEVHKVKVYDKAAPQQQPLVKALRPGPEQQRARERTAPVR
ncbi:LPD7 domain-containing protein [Aquincola sp. MAHUQ-54]|uniref:LPD7 domain-containing protein n=1 Tax=Aquincola agrisoli TaxID=3119538 RepID=A0AAW9QAC7_9BURK